MQIWNLDFEAYFFLFVYIIIVVGLLTGLVARTWILHHRESYSGRVVQDMNNGIIPGDASKLNTSKNSSINESLNDSQIFNSATARLSVTTQPQTIVVGEQIGGDDSDMKATMSLVAPGIKDAKRTGSEIISEPEKEQTNEADKLAAVRLAEEKERKRMINQHEASEREAKEKERIAAEQLALEEERQRAALERILAEKQAQDQSIAEQQSAEDILAAEFARIEAYKQQKEKERRESEQIFMRLAAQKLEAKRKEQQHAAELSAKEEQEKRAAEQRMAELAAKEEQERRAAEQRLADLAAKEEQAQRAAEQRLADLAAKEEQEIRAAEQRLSELAAKEEEANKAREQEAEIERQRKIKEDQEIILAEVKVTESVELDKLNPENESQGSARNSGSWNRAQFFKRLRTELNET